MNLETHQLQWLCNHMGHDMDIHREHYRQLSGLLERVYMTKLFLIQDNDMVAKYAGKNLQEIDVKGEHIQNTKT